METSEIDQGVSGSGRGSFRVCRCCLSRGVNMTALTEREVILLEMITECKLPEDPCAAWLCYRCSLSLRRLLAFQKDCAKSANTLLRYYLEHPSLDKDSMAFFDQNHNIPSSIEPSNSNTLCIDVSTRSFNPSRTNIVSFSHEIKKHKNYTEDMTILFLNHFKMEIVEDAESNVQKVKKVFSKTENTVTEDRSTEVETEKRCNEMWIKKEDEDLENSGENSNREGRCKENYLKTEVRDAYSEDLGNDDLDIIETTSDTSIFEQQIQKKKKTKSLISTIKKNDSKQKNKSKTKKTKSKLKRADTLECDICNRVFTEPRNVLRHKETVHNANKIVYCDKCGMSFETNALLKIHFEVHSDPKKINPYICKICGFPYRTANNLETHMLEHTGGEFPCTECDNVFNTPGQLTMHKRIHPKVKRATCEICGKNFKCQAVLNEHARLHSGELPFKCEFCDKAYRRAAAMRIHRRTHLEPKPYDCGQCAKKYTCRSSLDWHVKSTHKRMRPFQCDICRKAFLKKCQLTHHMFSHSDSKPFNCALCGKSYMMQRDLDIHMKYHSGETYQCDLCSYKGLTQSRLEVHKKIHTSDRPFSCKLCSFRTHSVRNLSSHKRMHGKNKDTILDLNIVEEECL